MTDSEIKEEFIRMLGRATAKGAVSWHALADGDGYIGEWLDVVVRLDRHGYIYANFIEMGTNMSVVSTIVEYTEKQLIDFLRERMVHSEYFNND